VTLKRPAPLDADLRLETDRPAARLWHGDELLAVAERSELDLEAPGPPSLADAEAAEERFDESTHIYPGCFVCGPARHCGDGWRIFPGAIGDGRVAASWTAAAEFARDEGYLRPEFIWAALDCPGYFAVQTAAGPALLGRMAVRVHGPAPTGEPLVIQAWSLGSEGRKHGAGTALHAADGRLLAVARQIWVSLTTD
jgi:hypothetical protein